MTKHRVFWDESVPALQVESLPDLGNGGSGNGFRKWPPRRFLNQAKFVAENALETTFCVRIACNAQMFLAEV